MFLDKYLTEYDESLSGEGYVDPLGMLVIWSVYGQKIFNSRVNSISNDVRIYTLNLFNHYLIRKLIEDESVRLGKKLTSVYGGKDTLDFKHACLIHLENLFVYSMMRHEGRSGIETTGVLGITKGRRNWNESDGNPLLIFHKKDGQILAAQISLGASGRYKTPMVEMGYFDANYHYQQPGCSSLWKQTEQFVSQQAELNKLSMLLHKHFSEILAQNREQPQLRFNDISKDISEAFVNAFASPASVGNYARDYWLAVTGLDQGAAGALLRVLDGNAKRKFPRDLDSKEMLALAMEIQIPEDERLKLEHIERLEPFLANAMLLFTLMASKKSQSQSDVIKHWKELGRDESTLPEAAQGLVCDQRLTSVVTGTAQSRLSMLLTLRDTKTMDEQIKVVLKHHARVMEVRGQSPWIDISESGLIRTHVRPYQTPDPEEWPIGCWSNQYYFPQFKWLVRGYQGVSA